MQQFKFQESDEDLSCLQNYSSDELSLLNSRRRHNGEISERQSYIQRQNQEEIKEFKRQIQQRFKLSICNKIYTFPRIIKSFYDIVSSEEQDETASSQNYKQKTVNKKEGSLKIREKVQSQLNKAKGDTNNLTKINQKEFKNAESENVLKDNMKTNQNTGKRIELDIKYKAKNINNEKTESSKKEKKKPQRLKTEHQSSGCYLQTLRSKICRKN